MSKIYQLLILIIFMSHHQHGYPWPYLTTPPYRPLLPAGLQGYISYRHRVAVCRFELDVLPLLTHKSISLLSSSLLLLLCPACLVCFTLIVFVMGGRMAVALWGASSRTCSILLTAFLSCYRRAFSPYV